MTDAASASAHDAQRVLVGWRRAKEAGEGAKARHVSPIPGAALLAVLEAAARALRDELDPQTVRDLVAGADAVEREKARLARRADARDAGVSGGDGDGDGDGERRANEYACAADDE